jgi:hypothetical protein
MLISLAGLAWFGGAVNISAVRWARRCSGAWPIRTGPVRAKNSRVIAFKPKCELAFFKMFEAARRFALAQGQPNPSLPRRHSSLVASTLNCSQKQELPHSVNRDQAGQFSELRGVNGGGADEFIRLQHSVCP